MAANIEYFKERKRLAQEQMRSRMSSTLVSEYVRCVAYLEDHPLDEYIVHDERVANRLGTEGFSIRSLTTAWRVSIP